MSYDTLTRREFQVWALIARGRSNRAIASSLGVKDRAVEVHIANLFWKLGLWPARETNRRVTAAVMWAA